MSPRTTKKTAGQGRRNPPASFRLSATTLTRLDRIADALGTSRHGAIDAGAYFAYRALGLERQDVAFAIDGLARMRGDDGDIMGILQEYEETAEGLRFYVAVTVDGETELEDWSGSLLPVKVLGHVSASMLIKHDPTGVTFKLGTLSGPVVGNAFSVHIGDLPMLVLAPKGKNEAEVRRELRDSLELARKFRLPTGNPETEELPLDDD